MIKLAGSLCILGGGVLARYLQAAARRREMDTLSDLLSVLRRMAEEIRMARTPLPALLNQLAMGCGAETEAFLRAAAAAAGGGEGLRETWRREAEKLPLPEGARAAMLRLGERLCGDEESICKAILLAEHSLAREESEYIRRQPEADRRATALCLSGAALLVILLI